MMLIIMGQPREQYTKVRAGSAKHDFLMVKINVNAKECDRTRVFFSIALHCDKYQHEATAIQHKSLHHTMNQPLAVST